MHQLPHVDCSVSSGRPRYSTHFQLSGSTMLSLCLFLSKTNIRNNQNICFSNLINIKFIKPLIQLNSIVFNFVYTALLIMDFVTMQLHRNMGVNYPDELNYHTYELNKCIPRLVRKCILG